MLSSYADSVAPGTAANRARQAKSYVKFNVLYNFNSFAPTISQLCMYAQYLFNTHASPQTVKNYMSGAKTWVLEHTGDVFNFDSHDVQQLVKGFVKKSTHIPSRAYPLSVSNVLTIAHFVNCNPTVPKSVLPCIVIGFKCLLRSSNLLSPTMDTWGGPHTLLARNIKICEQGLVVSILSTKTKWDSSATDILLPSDPGSPLCPVRLWSDYYDAIKPWYLGPAFLTDSYLPLTARHVVGVMRAALANEKELDAGRVSMHSLRRGAAQEAAANDIPLQQIMTAGMWGSTSGVKPYLDTFPHIFKH